jgi:hypothetical protein
MLQKDDSVLQHLKILQKDLKKDLIGAQQKQESSQEQIENLFNRVFQSGVLYDKRMTQLKEEQKALNHTMDCIWHNLEVLITPLWKVEEGMFGIYDKVAQVYKELLVLKTSPKLNTNQVAEIQDKLNDIENRFKVDGKFFREGDKQVQSGQAVIISLIEKCYRLAHYLILQAPEVDPELADYKYRVEKLISDLNLMNRAPSAELKINKEELMQIQQELDEIDSQQCDSKFLDSSGNIPAGKAHLRYLIERAYDLVNDSQLKIESQEDQDHSFLDSIRQMEDMLQESTISIFALSKAKISELNDKFTNIVGILKEWLKSPKERLNQISSKVASAHRSGMSVLSKIYAELEPVADELMPVQNQLNSIRFTLLDLRNQFNRNDMTKMSKKTELKELRDRVESVYSELEALDKTRVDAKFICGSSTELKAGQDHLRSLMNECYCLVFELIDRCSVLDF